MKYKMADVRVDNPKELSKLIEFGNYFHNSFPRNWDKSIDDTVQKDSQYPIVLYCGTSRHHGYGYWGFNFKHHLKGDELSAYEFFELNKSVYPLNPLTCVPTDNENSSVDVVRSPKHYQLFPEFGLEIKDINKRLLDNMEDNKYDITLFEAGWYQQSMQYFERFYLKNGLEDLKKGIQTMQFVVDSMEQRLNKE